MCHFIDPPCWLNSVPPRAMRDAAPWVLVHDSPPLQHVHGPIALLVSGALGSNARPTDAPSLRRHVVEPLSRLSKVSVFVCVDRHNTSFASQALSWAETRAVHVDRHAPNQLERLRGCFERTVPENFALYVRTRPDAFWYGPLAVTTVDAISIRSRSTPSAYAAASSLCRTGSTRCRSRHCRGAAQSIEALCAARCSTTNSRSCRRDFARPFSLAGAPTHCCRASAPRASGLS